jgi:hypothetical protein
VLVPETLPRDRILRGEVKNDSLRKVTIEVDDLRLLDGEGERIDANATFIPGYAHSLYPYNRGPGSGPGRYPEEERRRLGQLVELQPGKSAPLTVSWRQARGSPAPVRLDYGRGTLPVPRRSAGAGEAGD